MGPYFTVQMVSDLKYALKATQELLKTKKWDILQVSRLN